MTHLSRSTLVHRATPLHLVPSPAPRARPATLRPQHVFAAALLTLVGMGMTATLQEGPESSGNAAAGC
jgi:hypothetical protein